MKLHPLWCEFCYVRFRFRNKNKNLTLIACNNIKYNVKIDMSNFTMNIRKNDIHTMLVLFFTDDFYNKGTLKKPVKEFFTIEIAIYYIGYRINLSCMKFSSITISDKILVTFFLEMQTIFTCK